MRNPNVSPLKVRENPRYFGQGLFDLRKIQRGREIDEDEVLAINHVLKSNATRYVAAPVEDCAMKRRVVLSRIVSTAARLRIGPEIRNLRTNWRADSRFDS